MLERIVDKTEALTGPEKAAALLLSLHPEQAAKIFEKLDAAEIKEISQVMSGLGKVKAEALDGVFQEFTDSLSSTGNLRGSLETTERLLFRAMDEEKAKSIMDEIRGPMGRTTWDKLANISVDVLADYLKNEYPQTVAVVLSKIRSENASKIFAKFNPDFAQEIIERMLRIDVINRDAIDNVEKTLRNEFMSGTAKTGGRDPYEIVANIFNSFDRKTEGKFMSFLEGKNPDDAEKIRALMFTFEDLLRLDEPGIQAVIRYADKSRLVLALKGAPENIRFFFFSNMSERAAKLLKEDMEVLGMVRLKDVQEAQMEIVSLTKTLSNRGEIRIPELGASDEEMVE